MGERHIHDLVVECPWILYVIWMDIGGRTMDTRFVRKLLPFTVAVVALFDVPMVHALSQPRSMVSGRSHVEQYSQEAASLKVLIHGLSIDTNGNNSPSIRSDREYIKNIAVSAMKKTYPILSSVTLADRPFIKSIDWRVENNGMKQDGLYLSLSKSPSDRLEYKQYALWIENISNIMIHKLTTATAANALGWKSTFATRSGMGTVTHVGSFIIVVGFNASSNVVGVVVPPGQKTGKEFTQTYVPSLFNAMASYVFEKSPKSKKSLPKASSVTLAKYPPGTIDGFKVSQPTGEQAKKYLSEIGDAFTSSNLVSAFPGYVFVRNGRLTADFSGATFTFTPMSMAWGPSKINENGSMWRVSLFCNRKITPQNVDSVDYYMYTLLNMLYVTGVQSELSAPLRSPYVGSLFPVMYNRKAQTLVMSPGLMIIDNKIIKYQQGVSMPESVKMPLDQWLEGT